MPERGLERLRLGCQVHCEACHDSEHYSTILFGTHARAVIAAHPAESPLFLYLPVYQRCLFVAQKLASGARQLFLMGTHRSISLRTN